jgi:hypothetical protein
MTTAVYPLAQPMNPLQRIARALRSWMQRVWTIDLRYVDPWERKRS